MAATDFLDTRAQRACPVFSAKVQSILGESRDSA
jgi:hypothetical protein